MEKSEYIILLERFLKGETTHDEERILVDWFKSDVSRDELRNYIQRKWEIASNSSIPTDLKERMFRKIQSRIESVAVEKKEVGRFSLRNIMRYAAIGLLVICSIDIGWFRFSCSARIPSTSERSFLYCRPERSFMAITYSAAIVRTSSTFA